MLINLSLPRKFITDSINKLIFEMKMSGFDINRNHLILLAIVIYNFTLKSDVLAQDYIPMDIKQNFAETYISPSTFAFCDIAKQLNIYQVKYILNFIKHGKI
ncbi:MAG: hypothetical protein Q8936_04900 [Bacillota bacterium]|nr:hypothetical protein [Bacillota bacterium]